VASSVRNKPLPPSKQPQVHSQQERNLAKTHREASAPAPAIVTIVLAEEQLKKNDDGRRKKKKDRKKNLSNYNIEKIMT